MKKDKKDKTIAEEIAEKKIKKLKKYLKLVRKEKELSQEKISELAGLNTSYYSRIETGKSIPTLTTILKICYALEITETQFMEYFEKN